MVCYALPCEMNFPQVWSNPRLMKVGVLSWWVLEYYLKSLSLTLLVDNIRQHFKLTIKVSSICYPSMYHTKLYCGFV